MKRTYSHAAQFAFDTTFRLHSLAQRPNPLVRIAAKTAGKVFRPFARMATAGHLVDAHLYGQRLRMPAEHQLAPILANYPQFNRPLALTVSALATASSTRPLTVVDVGANIGETAAVIEQLNPGACHYLCIEADEEFADLCVLNHRGNSAVQTEQSFIGENEGALVRLESDGKANSATKLVNEASLGTAPRGHYLKRLDTVVSRFAEAHGSLSLIKVDTEGYDFSILRSGSALLNLYKPALYFEWFPALLEGLGENPADGFDFLAGFGYEHFVFFTPVGDYYCKHARPDRSLLETLAKLTRQNPSLQYFDVFTSTSEAICDQLVELSVSPIASNGNIGTTPAS